MIMTSKEKAEELLIKYQYNGIFITDIRMDKEEAVECALICVDELLHTLWIQEKNSKKMYRYYLEVKQEIYKL